jgi:hypothetical protein
MPAFEIAACTRTGAGGHPASCNVDLQRSALIRAIFKGRELTLRADSEDMRRPTGLVALTRSLGWGVLAEVPGREIVVGSVTQPWKANVTFRALSPDAFAAFDEPGYVKIVWSLRADPLSAPESIARTETRVTTTDPGAREKFRRYWSVFSPGIVLIRRVALRLVKADAGTPRTGATVCPPSNSTWSRPGTPSPGNDRDVRGVCSPLLRFNGACNSWQ